MNLTKPWKLSIDRRIALVQAIRDDVYRSMQSEDGARDQGLREYYRRLQHVIARHAMGEDIAERRQAVRAILDTVEHDTRPDFRFENHGSIWLLRPLTQAAREHLDNQAEAAYEGGGEYQFFGGALVVEPRYVHNVATALRNAGYNVA